MLGGFLHICTYTCTIYCGLWPPDNTSCIFLTWYQSPGRVPPSHAPATRVYQLPLFFSTVVFFTAVGLPWTSLGGRPSLICPVPWWPPVSDPAAPSLVSARSPLGLRSASSWWRRFRPGSAATAWDLVAALVPGGILVPRSAATAWIGRHYRPELVAVSCCCLGVDPGVRSEI
jgi:hypothetical protein